MSKLEALAQTLLSIGRTNAGLSPTECRALGRALLDAMQERDAPTDPEPPMLPLMRGRVIARVHVGRPLA